MSEIEETRLRKYTIDIERQVNDGLLTAEDMVDYFRNVMKIDNRKHLAEEQIEYVNNSKSVDVISKHGNIIKKNMKLYIKRFLRSKSLREFIKVSGDNADGFSLEYINTVSEAEE
ncbi:large subunit ribosomal protein L22e [Pancytospora epiphaga]|nr:large subunit ribosomal protein L22e [Pancytospora epiphaga]